jgi:hypothetical protein
MRLDRLSPGKTQKPKGTFSRAALSCDTRTKSQVRVRVNEFYAKNVIFIKKSVIPLEMHALTEEPQSTG